MKVSFSNLGPIGQAELTLAPLTVVCGRNNTGKTYMSYSFFGMTDYLRKGHPFNISPAIISELLETGTAHIDIDECIAQIDTYLTDVSDGASQLLPLFFASNPGHFKKSAINVLLDMDDVEYSAPQFFILRFGTEIQLSIRKARGGKTIDLTISGMKQDSAANSSFREMVRYNIGSVVRDMLLGNTFPNTYFASTERTGILSFIDSISADGHRKEATKIVPEEMVASKNILDAIDKIWDSVYPVPVVNDIRFLKQLKIIANKESLLSKRNPELVEVFNSIAGGTYSIGEMGVSYQPGDNPRLSLTVEEVSSSVRSLVMLSFWIRHLAKKGDMLMIDEPEMNLHPAAQRMMARWIAMLVNVGVRVILTTHSDYFVKELNTLIMLNKYRRLDSAKTLMNENGISSKMLLSPRKLKVYVASRKRTRIDGGWKVGKTTVKEAPIDDFYGVSVESFDDTINDMNKLQEKIVFGI